MVMLDSSFGYFNDLPVMQFNYKMEGLERWPLRLSFSDFCIDSSIRWVKILAVFSGCPVTSLKSMIVS